MRSNSFRNLPQIPALSTGVTRSLSRRLPPTPRLSSTSGSTSSYSSSSDLDGPLSCFLTRSDSSDSSFSSGCCSYKSSYSSISDNYYLSDAPCNLTRKAHIKRTCRQRPRPLPPRPDRQILTDSVRVSRSDSLTRKLPVPPLPASMFPAVSPVELELPSLSGGLLRFPLEVFESSLPRNGIDWDTVFKEMLLSA